MKCHHLLHVLTRLLTDLYKTKDKAISPALVPASAGVPEAYKRKTGIQI